MFCLIQIILIKSWLESTCCWHFILKIYGCEKLFPLKLWFSFIFSPFLLNQKNPCDFSVVINSIFSKNTLAFISGNSLFCIFLPCLLPPSLSELFISMLFSINPYRNIRSSSQIRQNSQVFHYSWFIAKWAHVLGKLSNMIRAFPTFCSGEKFPFQTSQSTIQNS